MNARLHYSNRGEMYENDDPNLLLVADDNERRRLGHLKASATRCRRAFRYYNHCVKYIDDNVEKKKMRKNSKYRT